MDITGETSSKDTWGAGKKTTTDTLYVDVPASYKKNSNVRGRVVVGDKPIAYGNYLLTFPVYHEGERINLESGHKLIIQERGDSEPEKVFAIIEIFDNAGITYEVEARKES
jgi:hypothetical protein